MRFFAVAIASTLFAEQVRAFDISLQGVQHLQTVDVVYSGLERGKEYFFTCYGFDTSGDIIATANGYAVGPVYSEELYFNTVESSSSIVRVECAET